MHLGIAGALRVCRVLTSAFPGRRSCGLDLSVHPSWLQPELGDPGLVVVIAQSQQGGVELLAVVAGVVGR
jgi:hypothetical protein